MKWNQNESYWNRNQRIFIGIGIGVESEKFQWNRNKIPHKSWIGNLNKILPGIKHH